jgi:hypothetical protein
MAWYEPGVGWTDYSFQADLAAAAEHYQLASARSLLVRFTDERNHYRFDESPGKEKGTATWRLVKVLAGQETELASAQGAPPPATELAGEQGLARVTAKWAFVKDDHQFRGDYWNSIEEKHRQAVDAADAACWKRLGERTRADLAKHPLQISRYAVEVQGDHIVCRVNGRDVLSARDSDLKAGTIGFRCQGGGVRWDDLVVAPMRQAR